MLASLRTLSTLLIACLLSACTGNSTTPLNELPRAPLEQAEAVAQPNANQLQIEDNQSATSSPTINKIALLLPMQGPLASVSRALRDGFLAAHYQAQEQDLSSPEIQLYDSTQLASLDDFYKQAQADGAQLVVGPLEKNLVRQLSERVKLPITTLALNYADSGRQGPAELFQFGLAAEDEAREVARRAWHDGMRSAVALTPSGEWGARVLAAFEQEWLALGGALHGSKRIDQPVALAGQIAELLQVRKTPLLSLDEDGNTITINRRQDVDFIFIAATPQQAQQIKPTLAFHYADDLPVYATSHLFAGGNNPSQYQDLDGIRFCETPWLLEPNNPLRLQVERQWPQAATSLGRLYAMGIDAWRLSQHLDQLKNQSEHAIEGMTGRLHLTPQLRIERQLSWAEFRAGQVQPLEASPY